MRAVTSEAMMPGKTQTLSPGERIRLRQAVAARDKAETRLLKTVQDLAAASSIGTVAAEMGVRGAALSIWLKRHP